MSKEQFREPARLRDVYINLEISSKEKFYSKNIKSTEILQDFEKIKPNLGTLKKTKLSESTTSNKDLLASFTRIPAYSFPSHKNKFTLYSRLPTLPFDRVPVPQDFGYALLTNAEDRAKLARRMVEMVVTMDARGVNTVVFCDRGARPLATLVSGLWSSVSERPLPAFFFVNTNTKNAYDYNASNVPPEILQDFTGWISSQFPDGRNYLRDGGSTVCVVDELQVTGRSAQFVAGLVKRAFGSNVDGIYCDWANAPRPWRDNEDMIGARTVSGSFKSEEQQTKMAQMLQQDLTLLALAHGRTTVHQRTLKQLA